MQNFIGFMMVAFIWVFMYILFSGFVYTITDDEYDRLYHYVMRHEMKNDIVNEKSPTQFVGWKEEND